MIIERVFAKNNLACQWFGFAMKLLVDVAQMLVRDMSVHLCRADVAVAQHGLHRPQVGAIHKKVGCITMAHRVWTNMFCDAC